MKARDKIPESVRREVRLLVDRAIGRCDRAGIPLIELARAIQDAKPDPFLSVGQWLENAVRMCESRRN
jgi:hypothetical protein